MLRRCFQRPYSRNPDTKLCFSSPVERRSIHCLMFQAVDPTLRLRLRRILRWVWDRMVDTDAAEKSGTANKDCLDRFVRFA